MRPNNLSYFTLKIRQMKENSVDLEDLTMNYTITQKFLIVEFYYRIKQFVLNL